MFFQEVFGVIEHAAKEIGTDLDGGFADAAFEGGVAFENEHAQAGVAAEEQDGGGRAGKCAADDNDIPGCRGRRGQGPRRGSCFDFSVSGFGEGVFRDKSS